MMGSLVLAGFRFWKDTRKQIKKYKCHFLQIWLSNNGPRTSFRFWGDNSKFSSSNHLLPFHVFWRRERSQGFWKKTLSLAGWKRLLRNRSQENSWTNCCQSGTTYKMAEGSREEKAGDEEVGGDGSVALGVQRSPANLKLELWGMVML